MHMIYSKLLGGKENRRIQCTANRPEGLNVFPQVVALYYVTNVILALCVQPHIHTLRRDPPLAEPGKIAVQFFFLCSEHLVQCCSVTSETASRIIYLFVSFQPSMTQGADLSGRLHPYTGCNPVCIPVLPSVFSF
jgi:hypothetical protein